MSSACVLISKTTLSAFCIVPNHTTGVLNLFSGMVFIKTQFAENVKTQFENPKTQFENAKTQWRN